MSNILLKTPISYYDGKQHLAEKILTLIPPHQLCAEPFTGGAAIFFAKRPAEVEILNDVNGELMNFYRVLQQKYEELHEEIRLTLHIREQHRHAWVVYNHPDLFTEVKRAWALWVLTSQSFGSMIDGGWGYDVACNTVAQKLQNKIESFNRHGNLVYGEAELPGWYTHGHLYRMMEITMRTITRKKRMIICLRVKCIEVNQKS